MPKTIRARYRNGVIEPMEMLDIPDGTELSVTIETALPLPEETKEGDRQRWRRILKGTSALQDHEREHREEVESEEDP